MPTYTASERLADVRYEIRGALSRRAHELEKKGHEIVHLNIGNPGRFGFRTPQTMRQAIIENMESAEAYCHQKGIFPAREAVVMQQQSRGVMDVTAEEVFIGNGVSELIDLTLRGLLNPGDEVLVPSPTYPLWTASVTLNGGRPVHYPCPPQAQFQPDLDAMRAFISPRTRAIVLINPNNPTGAVYPESVLRDIAALAREFDLVIMADEIYDAMTYDNVPFTPMATVADGCLCLTYSGLSKVYRACGYRVGWCSISGRKADSTQYLEGLELLAALRLCSNVTAQWAVQTALGGYQSIYELTAPGGRLFEARRTIIDAVNASEYLHLVAPQGAMYAFVGVDTAQFVDFDDEVFALRLLEDEHVLLAPGSSFNTPYKNYFRITLLPEPAQLREVFAKINHVLEQLQHAGSVAGNQAATAT
ncbi:MAG: aminotransferase class I/II-fold pyridoxal phosphate-dependent enzyme [Pseudomonadota bacterium]